MIGPNESCDCTDEEAQIFWQNICTLFKRVGGYPDDYRADQNQGRCHFKGIPLACALHLCLLKSPLYFLFLSIYFGYGAVDIEHQSSKTNDGSKYRCDSVINHAS